MSTKKRQLAPSEQLANHRGVGGSKAELAKCIIDTSKVLLIETTLGLFHKSFLNLRDELQPGPLKLTGEQSCN